MMTLIVRRLIQLPLILIAIYTITFSLAWLLPGNPLQNPEGRKPPPEVIEEMKRQYDLDSPWRFYVGYATKATGAAWVWDRFCGDEEAKPTLAERTDAHRQPIFYFGPSLVYKDWSVNEIIASSLPISVALGVTAILIALLIGLTAGIIGALRPGSLADLATLSVALVGVSLPTFVIGTILLMVFAVWLHIAPIGGWGTLRSVILPAVTLSLPFAAYIARLTRLGMIEALGENFIRTARAKGLPEHRVVLKHALKVALLPVLSYLGPAMAFAMTGSFVVERVFAVPGIGQHFVNGVLNKDLTLIMGIVLVYATMLIVFNLIVDVLYRWVDPRIELTGG
ncbi:MAG: ABC transporter permease [Phycisphaerales bacterium]|nr:ABC transporter permease [Phycisphaerales bacterium]